MQGGGKEVLEVQEVVFRAHQQVQQNIIINQSQSSIKHQNHRNPQQQSQGNQQLQTVIR